MRVRVRVRVRARAAAHDRSRNAHAPAHSPLLSSSLAFVAQSFAVRNFSAAEFLCFHINAYNLLAANMVVQHQCERDLFGACRTLPSIRDATAAGLGSVWTSVAGVVNNASVSLADLFDVLRAPDAHGYTFVRDARFHSALSAAAISAPDLQPASFEPATVDLALNSSMQAWLANSKKGLALDTINKVSAHIVRECVVAVC